LAAGFAFLFAAAGCWDASSEVRPKIAPAETANPLPELIAGASFMEPAIQAREEDEFDNPAFALIALGEKLYTKTDGTASRSCKDCHGPANDEVGLKLVAARFPKILPETNKPLDLPGQIERCRERHQMASNWERNSPEMLAMTAYLVNLAKGAPANPATRGGALDALFDRGRALFETRLGLLQLSCAQCHNQNYGRKFGNETLSQGHALDYPAFSLSEKRLVSLHGRFQMCNRLVRAEPQPEGADDYVALELYLAWRSRSLPFTGPGVRP
jgi:sulfur-oxidizing protein SoxA